MIRVLGHFEDQEPFILIIFLKMTKHLGKGEPNGCVILIDSEPLPFPYERFTTPVDTFI
jgi:hypothetical protein